MSELDPDLLKLVDTITTRLRMLQADFADQATEVRQSYLTEEIERGLSTVIPEQRQPLLDELKTRFPAWDHMINVDLESEDESSRSTSDLEELKDPSYLVTRLTNLVPALSASQKRVLIDRLREAGLADTGHEWPTEPVNALRKLLGVADGVNIDANNVLKSLTDLAEMVCRLDQLFWSTWKTIAPKSDIRTDTNLKEQLGGFISGDGSVSHTQFQERLEKLRQLSAALISSTSHTGKAFSQHFASKYSPPEIEAMASMEPGGLLVSREVKCWRKYQELAESLDPSSIDRVIMAAITEYAESLMKGLDR